MRRIYDSDALYRDDEEAHAPREVKRDRSIQAMRSIPSSAISDLLLPTRLRYGCILVDISTPRTEYEAGTSIPFTVTMKNRMPFPVRVETESPLVWEWFVDEIPEASNVPLRDPPAEPGSFEFDRGERKEFRKRWDQMFKVTEREWEPAAPGEYVLGAAVNVANADRNGLAAETTIEIVPS